jgi:hypothetical protein
LGSNFDGSLEQPYRFLAFEALELLEPTFRTQLLEEHYIQIFGEAGPTFSSIAYAVLFFPLQSQEPLLRHILLKTYLKYSTLIGRKWIGV